MTRNIDSESLEKWLKKEYPNQHKQTLKFINHLLTEIQSGRFDAMETKIS